MKKFQFLVALSCVPLAGLLYLLDMAKISTSVGRVEVNIYPAVGVMLLALVLLWRAMTQKKTVQ